MKPATKHGLKLAAAMLLLPATTYANEYAATGDAKLGARAFRQCQTCHVVVNDEGERLAGRGAKVGPNLYGVVSRQAGSVDGFKYSSGMVTSGEMGLKWNEAEFVKYVQDPTPYLREYTGDGKVRGKMSFKVRKEADALNLYAYLLELGPEIVAEEVVEEAPAEAAAAPMEAVETAEPAVEEAVEAPAQTVSAAPAAITAAVPAVGAGVASATDAAAQTVESMTETAAETVTTETQATPEVTEVAPAEAPAASPVDSAVAAGIAKIEAAAAEAIAAIKAAAGN